MSDDSGAGDRGIAVICGPTGAGKSRIAMWLALHSATASCSIISADSRQIYRGFDVGTAKPTPRDRALVPHFGIDVADPHERYSAARWANAAAGWIGESLAAGATPIVVGGTGLYLRALFDGLFTEPPLDPDRRRALSEHLATLTTEELRRWVVELDPKRAHLGRTQLLRAIEIAVMTGTPISHLHRDREPASRWRARMLVVDPGAALARRNEQRVETMLAAGWVDEVRGLMRDVAETAPAWNAAGYRTMRGLASGEFDPSSSREAIVIETRQYAKRQRTWFRHQIGAHEVTRLDPAAPGWEARVLDWWASRPGSL